MAATIDQPREAAFDAEAARGYDDSIRTGVPGYDLLHELTVALLRVDLGEEARVLCVGAGTGEEIVRLGAANPRWRVVGADPSLEMLAVAERRVAAAGLGARVELRAVYADELPAAERFDAATLLLVMHFLPDDGAKLALLRSVAERLVPGAPLVLADLHGDRTTMEFQRLEAAWRRRLLDLGQKPADVDQMLRRVAEHVHFVPAARLAALLAEVGFEEPVPFFRGLLFGGWVARRAGKAD